jgi:UDP-glucuronate 4-epimerase
MVLVTGAAGFIGFHLSRRLLERGERVLGLDSLTDYYDPGLKRARLAILTRSAGFTFTETDIRDRTAMEAIFRERRPRRVVHLAAQVGVRPSVSDPHPYVESNVGGFLHVLEGARAARVEHLVYASSSSVYGANRGPSLSPDDRTDHPVSLYAATKKANELMAHAYGHSHGVPSTGLRYFSVYGPWGRPDMALFRFVSAILAGEPIEIYNRGRLERNFTSVDDAIERTLEALDAPPAGSAGGAPCRVRNVGCPHRLPLLDFVRIVERALGREATLRMVDMHPGDALASPAEDDGAPWIPPEVGIPRAIAWYRDYYRA